MKTILISMSVQEIQNVFNSDLISLLRMNIPRKYIPVLDDNVKEYEPFKVLMCDKKEKNIKGEFVTNNIQSICFVPQYREWGYEELLSESGFSIEDAMQYIGTNCNGIPNIGYLYNITQLKVYDKPKKLGEYQITKAPQNFCYVEYEEELL